MGLILNGNEPINVLYNGAGVSLYFNGSKIWPITPDPYNPLNLPPNTIRVRTSDGNPPRKDSYTSYETATLVDGTTDVYDVYRSGDYFDYLLYNSLNVIEVLGANTAGIINMYNMFSGCIHLATVAIFNTTSLVSMSKMFYDCRALTTVPLFDTSNVTNMSTAFRGCTNLTAIPLFNTAKVIDMAQVFYNCSKVQSGALALYQQASTQATPPKYHLETFYNCGSNTTTGTAELAQIPSDWK